MRYSYGGKRREVHIGGYKEFPLAKARAERDRLRGLLNDPDNPQDPAQAKKAQQARTALAAAKPDTFQALGEDWVEHMVRGQIEKPEIVERVLRKWVYPVLGELPVNTIEPMQVIACLRKIVAAGAPTVANDARRHIQKIFDYGVITGTVKVNPAAQITEGIAGSKEKPRDRFLDLGEIKKLYQVMAKERDWFGRDNEITVRLLLMLGVRKGELIGARWSEIDDEAAVWTIPKARIKTRKKGHASDFRVPLPQQAVELLDELRARAFESAFVLPARRVSRRSRSRNLGHISPDTVNFALARLDHGLDPFTVHDLRRTCRSQLSALGVPFAVAERCLNHKLPGQGEIYDRHDLLDQRRQVLTRWADCLDLLEAKGEKAAVKFIGGAEITPLRRSA
jgi:integrase